MKTVDLTNKKFGKLTALYPKTTTNGRKWFCSCECGSSALIKTGSLVNGDTTSCGCNASKKIKIKSLIGTKFGKWVVTGVVTEEQGENKRNKAEVTCECGSKSVVDLFRLESGRTQCCRSCAHKGQSRNSTRLPKGVASLNHLFGSYKRRAARKNLEFLLTKEQFSELCSEPCYYCDRTNSVKSKSKWDDTKFNSLDRVDSSKGYTMDNVVPCCKICNWMKNSMDQFDFLYQCALISNQTAKRSRREILEILEGQS